MAIWLATRPCGSLLARLAALGQLLHAPPAHMIAHMTEAGRAPAVHSFEELRTRPNLSGRAAWLATAAVQGFTAWVTERGG